MGLPGDRGSRGVFALLTILLVAAGLAFASPFGVDAQAAGAPLFRASRAALATPPHTIGLVRSRAVAVDVPQLGGPARAAASALTLNLFDDVTLVAVLQRTESTASGGTAWIGQIVGEPTSLVSFVSDGGVVNGLVLGGGKQYRVEPVGGTPTVLEIDQGAYPRDLHPAAPAVPAPADGAPRTALADDGSTIDVLVVYTANALAGAGSGAAMAALIDQAIAITNQAYLNSGVRPRLRLVGIAQIDYAETGNLDTALTAMAWGSIPNVRALRSQYGADLVAMIVESGGPYCGIGYLLNGSAALGYSVVARECAVGNFSFAHELGHNMGANHDMYVNPGPGYYAYSHGYVHLGATSSGSWRSIMAYSDLCRAAFSGQGCQRLGYFSSPNVVVNGVPIGDASTADNSRTFNNTAAIVANFRQSVVDAPAAAIPVTATNTPEPATPTANPATPTPTFTPSPTSTPTPTPRVSVVLVPGATGVHLAPLSGVALTLPSVPSGSNVSLGVDTVTSLPSRLSSTSRSQPVKVIVVELSIDGRVSHATLPQAATVSLDFTSADLPAGVDPLSLKLFLSSDGQSWQYLTDTRVTTLGGSSYRATASVQHFSQVALAVPRWRIMMPAGPRDQGW